MKEKINITDYANLITTVGMAKERTETVTKKQRRKPYGHQ